MHHRALGLLALLSLAALAAAGCGDDGAAAPCPTGYEMVDGLCRRQGLVDDTGQPPRDADGGLEDTAEPTPDAAPDAVPDAVPDAAPDGGGETDTVTPPDVPTPQPGTVGAPCRLERECEGDLGCLGWTGGYCTRYDCDAPGNRCPAQSVCLRGVVQNQAACFRECATAAECRGGDPRYACKTLPDDGGDAVSICHELSAGPQGYGAACTGHADCLEDLACVSALPGGACLQLFCAGDPACETRGGHCVLFDGVPTCLVGCREDADCASVGDGTLGCGAERDGNGDEVRVCVSAQQDLLVGAACLADNECASGVCATQGHAVCRYGDPAMPQDLPCFDDTDCWPAGSCGAPGAPIAACSQPCGPGRACPAGSRCTLSEGTDGSCRPPCSTTNPCPDGMGWSCRYGAPYGDEGNLSTVCHLQRPGGLGEACNSDNDCADDDGQCFFPTTAPAPPEDAWGYCSRGCRGGPPCPFGTYCPNFVDNPGVCLRLCRNPVDCPPGHECRADPSGQKVCVLPAPAP